MAATNGPVEGTGRFIDSIDPEDPEYIKDLQRPAQVKEDMLEMDKRKRVSLIMNSQAFREELEQIVESQIKSGIHPASLIALQQISELVLPHSRITGRGAGCLTPIADIRGVDSLSYSKGEKLLRCKLAAVYRLVDLFNWTHGVFNHITVRISQEQEHFLLNPFGMMYHEITAASLVKVDMQGNVVDSGTTTLGVNVAGFMLHSAIHAARPDIRCIIHLHTPAIAAVSAMKCGLLPICQEAMILGSVSYHDYQGILVDPEEREQIARDLGPVQKVLFLRNHGVVACGSTIEEAWHLTFNLVSACETQIKAMAGGLDNLIEVSPEVQRKTHEVASRGGGGVDGKELEERREGEERRRKWKVGELEFEALMRMLDNAGYKTGYIYHNPLIRLEASKSKHDDVEYPPSSSNFSYQYENSDHKFSSPLKMKKQHDKSRWLNSPNVYQKIEITETGTNDPKKITKWIEVGNGMAEENGSFNWVQDGSPTHSSTPIKIDTHQFAPPGISAKEFKERQKELKKDRMQSKVTSGPQSKILEGLTWEEAKRLQTSSKDATMSGTGDHVIVVGAASKGIIQREHQHNAVVYKTYYAPNPFDSMTDEDLEKYKNEVERKQRGEPDLEEELLNSSVEVKGPEVVTSPEDDAKSPQQSPTSPLSEDEGKYSYTRADEIRYQGGVIMSDLRRSADSKLSPQQHEPQILINDAYHQQKLIGTAVLNDHLQRTQSARYPKEKLVGTQDSNFQRSQSTRIPSKHHEIAMNGEEGVVRTNTMKSTDSGEHTATSRSSKEGSPTKEVPEETTKDKKKKKKGLRTPSFLKKKKDKSKKKEEEAK